MGKGNQRINGADELRRKAEELVGEHPAPESISLDEARRLVHELRVYQTELQMQNDALREAQAELIDSSERYADLYDFAPVGYLTLDENGVILEANLTLAKQLGVDRGALVGRLFPNLIAPTERRAFRAHLARIFETREPQAAETTLLTGKKGVVLHALLESIFVEDSRGRKQCRISVTDISDRKEIEEALRRKEMELREAQRIARIGNWYWDLKADVTTGSDELLRIHGFDPKTQSLPPFREQRGRLYPVEDWELVNAAVQNAVRTGAGYELDVRAYRNGEPIWVTTRGEVARDSFGKIVGLRGTVQDITELKQIETELRGSEEELRHNNELLQKIVDGITDPLIMLDNAGCVTLINRAAGDYYGTTEITEFFGRPCFEGLRGRQEPCQGCNYPFPAVARQSLTFERKGLIDPKKVERITVYPILNSSGARDALVIKISDVTQSRILERQILQNDRLATLGLVTSGIAHEINNPNSFIVFNVPILRRYLQELMPILDEYAAGHPEFEVLHMSYEEFREDIFRLIGNMEHGSQRISNTIEVLKSFVRKRESEGMQEVDLKQLVDKVVALCHTELRQKVSAFEVLAPGDLPLLVSDPEALEQVLLNLLINAIHACDKPDSHVSLHVKRGLPGSDDFIFEVTDNGSGIEDAARERIFDPFFTTKSPNMGTGLGLYICHNHVTALGGRIEVESKVGEGTTFRVVLPATGKRPGG
ncbi:MAG: ATP-binding protein [Syntrophobacteraceae bacterium]